MDTFVLVRPLPRVGASSAEEVKALSARSNDAVRACHAEHGEAHHIKWLQSYVADDVMVCVYKASDEQVLRVRPRGGGAAWWMHLVFLGALGALF